MTGWWAGGLPVQMVSRNSPGKVQLPPRPSFLAASLRASTQIPGVQSTQAVPLHLQRPAWQGSAHLSPINTSCYPPSPEEPKQAEALPYFIHLGCPWDSWANLGFLGTNPNMSQRQVCVKPALPHVSRQGMDWHQQFTSMTPAQKHVFQR